MRITSIEKISILTYGPNKLFDITERVKELASKVVEGVLFLQAIGSTGALLVLPTSREVLEKFERDLWDLVSTLGWRHPGNAYAHLRSTLMGVWLALPVTDGKVVLGKNQGVYFLENQPALNRRRTIIAVLVQE